MDGKRDRQTVVQLLQETQQALQEGLKSGDKFRGLLQNKLKHPNQTFEMAAMAAIQAPDIEMLKTAWQWRQMGYHVKDIRNRVNFATLGEQTYVLNAQSENMGAVQDIDSAEHAKMRNGQMTSYREPSYKLHMFYDATQTNCTPEEYAELQMLAKPCETLGESTVYQALKNATRKYGFTVTEKADMNVNGFYKGLEEIHISSRLHVSQQITTLCECLADGLVAESTDHGITPALEFEASVLACLIKAQLGVSVNSVDLKYAGHKFDDAFIAQPYDIKNSLSRLEKMEKYTNTGIGNELGRYAPGQELGHGATAKKQMDFSNTQNQVNQNFMRNIE